MAFPFLFVMDPGVASGGHGAKVLVMSTRAHPFKFTVAAFALAVGYSLPAAAQEPDVDALLDQLADAQPGEDGRLVAEIFLEWSKSGSPAIDLLLQRGQDALEAGDYRGRDRAFHGRHRP